MMDRPACDEAGPRKERGRSTPEIGAQVPGVVAEVQGEIHLGAPPVCRVAERPNIYQMLVPEVALRRADSGRRRLAGGSGTPGSARIRHQDSVEFRRLCF